MDLNRFQFIGRLTSDPQTQAMPDGRLVSNFTLATNKSHKNKAGEWEPLASFIRLTAFGARASVCSEFKRGDKIYVEGMVSTRTTEKDGVRKYHIDFVIDKYQFIASPKKDSDQLTSWANQNKEVSIDDIPF